MRSGIKHDVEPVDLDLNRSLDHTGGLEVLIHRRAVAIDHFAFEFVELVLAAGPDVDFVEEEPGDVLLNPVRQRNLLPLVDPLPPMRVDPGQGLDRLAYVNHPPVLHQRVYRAAKNRGDLGKSL